MELLFNRVDRKIKNEATLLLLLVLLVTSGKVVNFEMGYPDISKVNLMNQLNTIDDSIENYSSNLDMSHPVLNTEIAGIHGSKNIVSAVKNASERVAVLLSDSSEEMYVTAFPDSADINFEVIYEFKNIESNDLNNMESLESNDSNNIESTAIADFTNIRSSVTNNSKNMESEVINRSKNMESEMMDNTTNAEINELDVHIQTIDVNLDEEHEVEEILTEDIAGFTMDAAGNIVGLPTQIWDGLLILPSDERCRGFGDFEESGMEDDVLEIYIPENIVYIAPDVIARFEHLIFINASEKNPVYYSEGGKLYDTVGTLIAVPIGQQMFE